MPADAPAPAAPARSDAAFLADVRAAAAEGAPGALHCWWLGQSGFLVYHDGRYALLDPYLSDSLTRKYAATDKPHVRLTARVVAPEDLAFVPVATASHLHTDHLDGETLRPLLAARDDFRLVLPAALVEPAGERLGCGRARLRPVDAGETVEEHGVTFTAVPAAHEALERDAAGRHLYLGFIVRLGPWTLYHAGDTVRYDGQVEAVRPHRPDVALLPINGRAPERRVSGNLDGPEAARLARDVGAGLAVPCHFGMFAFNTADPGPFAATCHALGQPCAVLRAGERVTLAPPPGSGRCETR